MSKGTGGRLTVRVASFQALAKKMRAFAILTFVVFPLSSMGDTFSNWYFEFHSQKLKISGVLYSPDDLVVGKFSGMSKGRVSQDGSKFIVSVHYINSSDKSETKSEVIWTNKGKGVFSGTRKLSGDRRLAFELVVNAKKSYRVTTRFPDGTISKTVGTLSKDMVMSSKDLTKTKDGELMGKMEFNSAIEDDTTKDPKG